MRCRIGDLAVIVGCVLHPQNNGKLVTVLRRSNLRGYDWFIEAAGGPLLGFEGFSKDGNIRDRLLRPIRPQPDADETLRDVPVDAGGREVVVEAA